MKHSRFHRKRGIFFLFALASGTDPGIFFRTFMSTRSVVKINLSAGLRMHSRYLLFEQVSSFNRFKHSKRVEAAILVCHCCTLLHIYLFRKIFPNVFDMMPFGSSHASPKRLGSRPRDLLWDCCVVNG